MTVSLVAASRSPMVLADGALAQWHPVELAAVVMREVIARAQIDPSDVAEVWVGCGEPVGAQGADMARAVVLAAGWPDSVGGTVVDRAETSGTAALHAGAAAVETGTASLVVVLGVSGASIVRPGASALARTYGRPWGDSPAARYEDRGGLLPPQRVAELDVARLGIGREIQDEVTRKSHELRRAADPPAAIVEVAARPGSASTIQRNAPIASDSFRPLPDDLDALPATFADGGTITAASFAPAADGVTAVVLGPPTTPASLAVLRGRAQGAGDPFDSTGAIGTTIDRALGRAGLTRAEVDRWEVVEPSAAAFLTIATAIADPTASINPDGGALATGDAAAAEELRLAVDALHRVGPGGVVVTLAGGPTGSAVSVWERAS